MAKVTGPSGNEIYCLALKQYSAGELVVGNSVNSMGFLGSLGAGGGILGSLKTLAPAKSRNSATSSIARVTPPLTAQSTRPAEPEPIRSSAFERRSSAGPVRIR